MEYYQPMIALNVYLEPYFREVILRRVLSNRTGLPDALLQRFVSEVKAQVKVSGFRNVLAAPTSLFVRNAEKPFEKDSEFLRVILECWASTFAGDIPWLKEQFVSLGFTPTEVAGEYPDADNAFLTGWPKGVTYSKLEQEIKSRNSALALSRNEIALLAIWVTGFLPGPDASLED